MEGCEELKELSGFNLNDWEFFDSFIKEKKNLKAQKNVLCE